MRRVIIWEYPLAMRDLPFCAALASALVIFPTLGTVSADSPTQAPVGRPAPPVAVDFRVVADDGQPVLDLKREDVVLKIGGRAREIRALELIQSAAGPRPFATNTLVDAGQDVLLVLDEDSIAPGREQPVREALGHLLAGLSTSDRVGLFRVSASGGNISQTPRGGIDEVLAGLSSRSQGVETSADIACRTRVTLETLKGVFEGVAIDEPSTLVFFSAGLAAPSADPTQLRTSSGVCQQVRLEDFQDFAKVAHASRANVYVVQLLDGMNLAGSAAPDYMAVGVESLAGAAGGEVVRVTGSGKNSMTRLAHEVSTYYLATFEPEASERDGARRRVELRVAREGVRVRARPELAMPKTNARAGKGPSPRDMLRLPTIYRDLPLRAAAYASRNAGDSQVKVVVLFESIEPSVALTSATIGAFDEKGRLKAQWTAEATDLKQAPAMAALAVPAGSYRLRVAATDASGRAGTVDEQIQASLTRAGSLQLSALVLGVSQNRAFAPRLQFGAEPVAIGYFELYGTAPNASVSAQLELAQTGNRPALASVPATIEQAPGGNLRIAYGALSIETLPPGDFVLRAIVSVNDERVGQLTRMLRKAQR